MVLVMGSLGLCLALMTLALNVEAWGGCMKKDEKKCKTCRYWGGNIKYYRDTGGENECSLLVIGIWTAEDYCSKHKKK